MKTKISNLHSGIFRSMVEKSLNEIFLIDPDSLQFIYGNPSIVKKLGYTYGNFLELNFPSIVTAEHRENVLKILDQLINRRQQQISLQVDFFNSDEYFFPVHIQLEWIKKNGEEYILGICQDLSHQKRNKDLLEEQKKKTRNLQLSNKYKSDFYANLSHEMRTTLNSVSLLSEILYENRSKNLKKSQLKYTQTIHNSTNSLLKLLNEVLDLSKIESGKMSMRPELLEVKEFCKELERLFQPVAREKGLRFQFIDEIKVSPAFNTDRLRLEQVLKNLISNALKFTVEGYVKLRLFHPENQNKSTQSTIGFQVIDTGVGIPDNQLENIFESYIQAEGSKTYSDFGGTGLGLSISKQIVQLLGGTISVESTLKSGSIFTIEVPMDSSEAILSNAKEGKIKLTTTPAIGDRIVQKVKSKPKKLNGTVLLIDDSETHNMALSEFLNFKIKKTLTAESAKNAFEILSSQTVHCIILDMYLPDASGREVLQKLKSNKRYSSIPVIIYSGKNFTQEEEEELGNLADAIIQKNVMSYKVLLPKVIGVLQKVI
ncbi:MAG: ATP-binding protein [Gracilimonas sp.]